LQGRGHRVLLYCNRPVVAEGAARMGVPSRIAHIGGDVAIFDAVRFGLHLRNAPPDVLIVGTYKKLFHAVLAARIGHIPRVVARVGLESDVPRAWKYRYALRHGVDLVVVTAERMRGPFVDLLGEDSGRVTVIPNAAPSPPELPSRAAARAELGLPPAAPLIGVVARLASHKRLDRFLRALSRFSPEVQGVIAGDGPERAALEQLSRDLGLGGRVHFLGHREHPWPVNAALDLMVISSDREGMSNAMLEAIAAGVPVLSTPVSGAADALHAEPDGRRPGVVLETFSEEELATVLHEVISSPTRLAEMREAACARARSEFNFDLLLDRWEAALTGGMNPSGSMLTR